MASRISLFNHFGQWLTEINATFNRSYKLNEFGVGTFTMSTQDPKCREDYLQFGNFVLVEHDKLPAWGGMIDTPRQWGIGSVTSTAYSGEYILTTMITDRTSTNKGAWGVIYQNLVEETFNNDIGGIIKIGSIFGGGKSIQHIYHFANIYEEIVKLSKDSGNDWEFVPSIDENGRLYFTANWYEKRGMLKQYTLYEDFNIKLSSRLLQEQGRIANQLRIYGEGANWQTRSVAKRHDKESIGKYGARFLAQAKEGDDLNANADQLIKDLAYPRKTYDIAAIDIDDTFYQCRIGDKLSISCHSVGFSGSGFGSTATVRILQMAYDEENNGLKLVADEVR